MQHLPSPVIDGPINRLVTHVIGPRLGDPIGLVVKYHHERHINQKDARRPNMGYCYAWIYEVHQEYDYQDDDVLDHQAFLGSQFIEEIEPWTAAEDEPSNGDQ